MKKILLLIFIITIKCSYADEGMWIPSLIGKNYNEMQRLGLKLTPQDIYDINHASLKDAIVSFGGYCTAEIVSSEGLLLTNHHCAFEAIADQSTTGQNYLKDGFWAMNRSQEMNTQKAYAAILDHIEDISDIILPAVRGLDEQKRRMTIKKISDSLIGLKKGSDKFKLVTLAEFFNGNQYFLFVYNKYNDVRLVGVPPESIGKFGGDTDNWMWPRHTGDFSILRIYANSENKPADFSKDNVPFKPKKYLPISMKGVQNNDYAMIMGFPGRTQRYEFSQEIDNAQNIVNPMWIKYWKMFTETMKTEMDKDPAVNLKMASTYAQLMNYYKYAIGQTTQLKRLRTVDNLRKNETSMKQWINADASRKEQYNNLFPDVEKLYSDFNPYEKYRAIIRYGLQREPTMSHALVPYLTAYEAAKAKPDFTNDDAKKMLAPFGEGVAEFYKEYDANIAKNIIAKFILITFNEIPTDQRNAEFTAIMSAGDPAVIADKWAQKIMSKSVFTDAAREKAFYENPTIKAMKKDPLFKLMDLIYGHYNTTIRPKSVAQQGALAVAKRNFMKAKLEMNPDKLPYPDANSTERVTYGVVKDYDGLDAIHYHYLTYADGILEKEDPTNPEFAITDREHNLLMAKNYGPYAEKSTGKLPVAFLTTNDITGGNSGSPVINANGEQIGIAFDGNWEAMSGDIDFAGDQKRTICVDIRYVLWCIDKYAGAGYLIKEMTLVE